MLLFLSIAALVVGPLLYGLCQKIESVRAGLDGLLFVTIAGIVVVHIVPDVYAVAGIPAIAFLVAGALLAFFVERWPATGDGDRYIWIVLLGAIGLAVHAAMDGIALLSDNPYSGGGHDEHGHGELTHGMRAPHSDHGHGEPSAVAQFFENHLALGVILHRLPVGMAIWWVVRPALGKAVAISALVIIALATSAAYLLGDPVIALMEAQSVAYFQAFVAGTLLHVIVLTSLHGEMNATEAPPSHTVVGERVGIITGLILLFLLPHAH